MSMKKKRLISGLMLVSLALVMLPMAASAAFVAVTNSDVSVYATGHLGSPVVATLSTGTRVQVITSDANWTAIRLGGETGYVVTSGLTFYIPQEPTPAPEATDAPHEKVMTEDANATIKSANHGPVHVRAQPDLDAGLINTFANGSRIHVLSQSGGWYYVRAGENTGYIDAEFVELDENVSLGADIVGGYDAVVANPTNEEILHLRSLPSLGSASLGEYRNGAYVKVLGIGLEWMHVMVDGKEGYMMSEYVHVTSPNATSERIVAANGGTVELYAEPNTGASVLAEIQDGSVVNVLIAEPEWSKVHYVEAGNIQTGYVENRVLKDEQAAGGNG